MTDGQFKEAYKPTVEYHEHDGTVVAAMVSNLTGLWVWAGEGRTRVGALVAMCHRMQQPHDNERDAVTAAARAEAWARG